MKWISKLEKRFRKYAIERLIEYIIIGNAIAFIMMMVSPGLVSRLVLVPQLVLQGEVWRVITFLLIPPQSSPIFIFFALYILYMYGTGLEHAWGAFRFNLYYFIGAAATVAASLVFGVTATNSYLNLSLLLAFAALYPDVELRLFFILPIKIRYIGWFTWGIFGWSAIVSGLPVRMLILASVLNYFLFFGPGIINSLRHGRGYKAGRLNPSGRRPAGRKDGGKAKVIKPAFHKCTVCGKTELDDPMEEFRYCSKCEGHYEYCSEHLPNHEHKKAAD